MNKNDSPMNADKPDTAAPDVQPCSRRVDSGMTKLALIKWLAGAGAVAGAGAILVTVLATHTTGVSRSNYPTTIPCNTTQQVGIMGDFAPARLSPSTSQPTTATAKDEK
ncbi:MAG: hypothetical protein EHM48_05105 [Planctomycetaceae bacterium]|nr:MAG: hypothetical protein EHM48_05105 [Planctomycetaceae bacterium]